VHNGQSAEFTANRKLPNNGDNLFLSPQSMALRPASKVLIRLIHARPKHSTRNGLILPALRVAFAALACVVIMHVHGQWRSEDGRMPDAGNLVHLLAAVGNRYSAWRKLPPLAELQQEGWLYPHQVKSIDYRDRGVSFVASLDHNDFLIDLMERVRALIDPDSVL